MPDIETVFLYRLAGYHFSPARRSAGARWLAVVTG